MLALLNWQPAAPLIPFKLLPLHIILLAHSARRCSIPSSSTARSNGFGILCTLEGIPDSPYPRGRPDLGDLVVVVFEVHPHRLPREPPLADALEQLALPTASTPKQRGKKIIGEERFGHLIWGQGSDAYAKCS